MVITCYISFGYAFVQISAHGARHFTSSTRQSTFGLSLHWPMPHGHVRLAICEFENFPMIDVGLSCFHAKFVTVNIAFSHALSACLHLQLAVRVHSRHRLPKLNLFNGCHLELHGSCIQNDRGTAMAGAGVPRALHGVRTIDACSCCVLAQRSHSWYLLIAGTSTSRCMCECFHLFFAAPFLSWH